MNAFIQIISQLVEAIPETVWLEQRFFPFRDVVAPRGRLFDACIFRQGASGALGFLWVEFDGTDEVLTIPFRLARYSEDGDLITLAPWSLREASADSELYEAWRRAIHVRNPIPTARDGQFSHRFCNGEPALLALGIWSDSKNTCVRLESQEAYKIFRTFSPHAPQALEVEVLEFLTHQNSFLNFPRLVSVFEYSQASLHRADIAISTKYIQNSGTLWQDFTSRIQLARYPQRMHERTGHEAWDSLVHTSELLGRLFGEFHRAMTHVREHSNLSPESNTGAIRLEWLKLVEGHTYARANVVAHIASKLDGKGKQFATLQTFARGLLDAVRKVEHLGLLIRNHGHAHLGQILLSSDQLFLLDFEADAMDDFAFRSSKQSALVDLAAMQLSLKYAWHTTNRGHDANIFVDFLDTKTDFGRHVKETREHFVAPVKYTPKLQTLESNFLRFYIQTVREESGSSELIPHEHENFQALYALCLFMRILKETIRDYDAGNPRFKLSLQILEDFMTADGAKELHESVPDYV